MLLGHFYCQNDRFYGSLLDSCYYPLVAHDLKGGTASIEINLSEGEIGSVERIEALVVVFLRVLLGQEEGLGGSPLVIDRGEIEAGIKSVVASAGEDNPVGVDVPVVVAVCPRTVDFVEWTGFSCLQVEQLPLARLRFQA